MRFSWSNALTLLPVLIFWVQILLFLIAPLLWLAQLVMLPHETFNLDEDQHNNFKDPKKHFCNCLLKCLITFNYTQQAPFPCWNNSWDDTSMPPSLDQVMLLGTMHICWTTLHRVRLFERAMDYCWNNSWDDTVMPLLLVWGRKNSTDVRSVVDNHDKE